MKNTPSLSNSLYVILFLYLTDKNQHFFRFFSFFIHNVYATHQFCFASNSLSFPLSTHLNDKYLLPSNKLPSLFYSNVKFL